MRKPLFSSNEAKKSFMGCDLAERMIRVEQNISHSFGKLVPYNKTNFYLSMSPKQKTEYEYYLKNKTKKKFFFSLFALLPLLFIGLINFTATGNAIKNNISESNTLLIEGIVIGLCLVFILAGIFSFISKLSLDKKVKHHTKVIDKIIIGKRLSKK